MNLKEKIAKAYKIECLTEEFNRYSEAAKMNGKFTDYYMQRAKAVGFKLDKIKEEGA